MFCSAVQQLKGQGHERRDLPTGPRTIGIVLLPLQSSGGFYAGFKGTSSFLRISIPILHLFKHQQRGEVHQGANVPSSPIWQSTTLGLWWKGDHTFCIGDSYFSLTLDALSPIPSTIQPQIRQHRRCLFSIPSGSWANLWWHCLNEILIGYWWW